MEKFRIKQLRLMNCTSIVRRRSSRTAKITVIKLKNENFLIIYQTHITDRHFCRNVSYITFL